MQQSTLEPSVPYHRVDQRQQQICLQLCRKGRCLVKIRAAENSVIHMNIPPRRQQPHKRAAQRAAIARPDMSAAMFLNVSFYFLCFLRHSGKLGMFRFIEAIVADAEDAIPVRQQRNDPSKIAPPVAAGAGKQ